MVQVDHILPWSRFGDDSYNNKTLCFADENIKKACRTPYQWFGKDEERWETFVRRVETNKDFRGFKKRNYLLKNADEAAEKFRSRNLNDTRYAARVLAEAAKLFFPEGKRQEKDGTRSVYTRPGALTAALRKAWHVEHLKKVDGKRVDDARHHALDAAVVAAVSEREVQKLTDSFQQWEQRGLGRKLREIDEPWDGFSRQLCAMYRSQEPPLRRPRRTPPRPRRRSRRDHPASCRTRWCGGGLRAQVGAGAQARRSRPHQGRRSKRGDRQRFEQLDGTRQSANRSAARPDWR